MGKIKKQAKKSKVFWNLTMADGSESSRAKEVSFFLRGREWLRRRGLLG